MQGYEIAKLEILEWIADAIQVPLNDIDLTKPLTEIGLDSLDVEVR